MIADQSVVSQAGAVTCTAAIAACKHVGAPARRASVPRRSAIRPLADQARDSTAERSCAASRIGTPSASTRVPARGGAERHDREQAERLGLARHEVADEAAQPQRLGLEIEPHQRAGLRGVGGQARGHAAASCAASSTLLASTQ